MIPRVALSKVELAVSAGLLPDTGGKPSADEKNKAFSIIDRHVREGRIRPMCLSSREEYRFSVREAKRWADLETEAGAEVVRRRIETGKASAKKRKKGAV